jgi:DNA (cytosine-5)-methyltransferase 1
MAVEKLRVLDLFSGIGGFSLGLERTGGFRTVAFCEINPYCRAVLKKHWPGIPIWRDVRSLRGFDGVDLICGGFPCQDISHAGSRVGITGERSKLWREFARLVGAIRPRYVIVENVAAITVRGLLDVLGDLAALRFDAEWDCVPASALGAPHQRDRAWIVAYPAGVRRNERERAAAHGRRLLWPRELDSAKTWDSAENNDEVRSRFIRVVDGVPARVERLNALGNAVVPQIPEIIGRAILEAERLRK